MFLNSRIDKDSCNNPRIEWRTGLAVKLLSGGRLMRKRQNLQISINSWMKQVEVKLLTQIIRLSGLKTIFNPVITNKPI